MYIVEVFVALVVVVVGFHFICVAFETHAFVASAACDSVASVDSDHWDFAFVVGALADSVLEHVFFEELVAAYFSLFAGYFWVILHLCNNGCTLHSIQYKDRQTSHSIWSLFIMLICLQPTVKQKVII